MKFGKKNSVSLNPLDYNICLLGESKCGKEQPVSEPVLTEFGWKAMGLIEVGDKVYGEDGNLYNVTGVFPQGVKDVYKVTFRDGTSTRCGAEHLWHVSTTKQRANMREHGDDRHKVLPLSEIMKDYKTYIVDADRPNGGRFKHKYSVPINKPMNFNIICSDMLTISPYALGLLLGDGGFTTNTITFTNAEPELFAELEEHLCNFGIELHKRSFENHWQATLCSDECRNPLKAALNDYGLLGCNSRTKFIPIEYKLAPIEDRIALLSGLINTDGHVTHNGKTIQYNTSSPQLAEDVAELARSLGFIASMKQYERWDKITDEDEEVGIDCRVAIIGNDYDMLYLSTKHKNKLAKKTIEYVKTITNIELVGREESQCIMLDNPNHLYITKDYIVTHNTTLMYQVCEKLVGSDGYMFLEMKGERGADAIEGINYVNCPDWNSEYDELNNTIGFGTLCKDIIENKSTDWANLKVLAIDTYDYFIEIGEEEAIRLFNKMCREKGETDKITQSINQSWGGFGRGEKKAISLMFDMCDKLAEVGVHCIFISHVKQKEISDVVSGTSYQVLTSDQQQNYFNALKKRIHFLGLAYVDRNIIREKTGKKDMKGKDIFVSKATSDARRIKFRSDDYSIDSGSRFADIVDEIGMDADEFIRALTNAIESESKKSGKSLTETKAEQDAIAEKKAERVVEAETKAKTEHELADMIDSIVEFIQNNRTDMDVVKPIVAKVKSLGYDKPTSIDKLEDAEAVLALCK